MGMLFELFFSFIKIGLFTFGGGLAMIPIIENVCVEKKGWITHEDMMNITVIAESTPGPIAINCATFVGYKKKGIIGGVFATLGVIIPSFIVILLISLLLDNFLAITIVANAFKGIKLAVGILILDASIHMIIKMEKNAFSYIVMIASVLVMLAIDIFSLEFSSMTVMLVAGLIGLIVIPLANMKRTAGDKK